MPEAYIPLETVATYEGIPYNTLVKRIERNPQAYKTRPQQREFGKPEIFIALSSLSPKARRKYRAENKTINLSGGDLTMKRTEDAARPWYLETDYHWYIEQYPEQYEKAIELAALMREFTDYCGPNRTDYSVQFAVAHGLTQRTLYRFSQAYLAAGAWAYRMEQETGRNHDFLKVLAMCRKPKEPNTFPSIDPEVKAAIENVWFNEDFRRNRCTVQLLYDELVPKCKQAEIPCPSYQTVTRYVNYLMHAGGQSAAFLAERGTRDWKNQYMMKGERDIKSLAVMEIVMGDVHTFDLFVKYTPPNGRPIAIRPKLIAWMDVRSRRYVACSMCRDSNTDDIKRSFAKVIHTHGAPMHLLIDNGKDFANADTLGHDRRERLIFNDECAGFYKALGVQDVFRSLPFQPWDKGQLERSFSTVCEKFSKRFTSYVGTLTGSRTDAKVRKNIKQMLERGELYTMEELYDMWDNWMREVYDIREHRGLRDAGEQYTNPGALFDHADDRYQRPAPPDSYIAMLLMPSKRVLVRPVGVRYHKTLYMSPDLLPHINSYVTLRANSETGEVYAFTEEGTLIGEIPLAERLNASFYADEEQVERHKRAQNRQLGAERDKLAAYRLPFGARPENADATPRLVGGVDLIQGKKPARKVISIPIDQEIAKAARIKAEKAREKRTDYLDKRGQAVLDQLEKLG